MGDQFGPGILSTPEVTDAGSPIGEDLPTLPPGEAYDFRVVATNNTNWDPVVDGAAQTLRVPVPAVVEPQAPCPNEAARTGLSAGLPDCRAYEQVTPTDKGGTFEPFILGAGATAMNAVGADGERFLLESPYTKDLSR